MSDGQTESQRHFRRQYDNDGSSWVCLQCGSSKVGPSVTTICPKGCAMMVPRRRPRNYLTVSQIKAKDDAV